MRRDDLVEGAPAVGRFPAVQVEHIDGLGVLRVGEDVAVVPGPLPQLRVIAHALPVCAAVVGTEEAAFFGLDDRPDSARLSGRDGDANLAFDAGWQAGVLADVGPAIAAI